MRKLVYIAGPYSNEDKAIVDDNIQTARIAAIWCADHSIFFYCPHLNSAHFERLSDAPVEYYYASGLLTLMKCDAILLVGTWWNSKGSRLELECAQNTGRPQFYFDSERDRDELIKWYRGTSE